MTRLAGALALALALVVPGAAEAQTYATEWLTTATDPRNRINLAILGDGYTADATSQAKLTADANAVLQKLFSTSPWSDVKPVFTAKLIHVVSAQSGATNGSTGGTRSTALGAYYGCNGTDRLICLDTSKALQIAAQHFPEYTFAFVIVNDSKYGGSGGTVSVVSTNASAPYLLIHEFAHSVAHLADEYTSAYPGYPTCSTSTDCPEANATLRTDRSKLKWAVWVDASTPVPTPSASGWPGIGAFEGARYFTSGVYRPKDTGCIMRSSSSTYCSVCREAILSYALSRVDLVDAASPATASPSVDNCGPASFSVRPVPLAGQGVFTTAWTVDGAPAGTGTSLSLPGGFAPGTHAVRASVTYASPLARNDPAGALAATVSWSVSVTACSGTSTPSPALALAPATASVPPRGALKLAASGGSGSGYVYALATNASGAAVDATGRYVAGTKGGGKDVVRVTDSAGAAASATITVTPGVSITPASATVAPRGTRAFSASGGSGAGFAWSVATNASGATIDSSGRYTAGANAGVDLLRVVDSLGNSASATVTVTVAATPSTPVAISPASATVVRGTSRTFSASGGSGTGYRWAITTNQSGATIDAAGRYVAGWKVGVSSKRGVTDVIRVTDSTGASATASVTVVRR